MAEGPRIHNEFPIRENLSPPFLDPVSDCAEAVSVSAFLPRAIVRVWSGATDLLAQEQPDLSSAVLRLRRPVKVGEPLTTTQEVGGQESQRLVPPVTVEPLNDSAVRTQQPDVGKVLFECGRIVPVGNLVPGGVRVHVSERDPAPAGATAEVGNEPAAQAWYPVVTFSGLHAGFFVSARQVACEGTDHEVSGPSAAEVQVQAAPSPPPAPIPPDPNSIIPGDTAVTFSGLLVGALVEVFDSGSLMGSGFANASSNYVPVWPPLRGGPVTARQTLCGPASPESPPVRPEGKIAPLTVLEPICAGSHFVVIRGARMNAAVVVFNNGSPVGYAGGKPGDLIVALDQGKVLNPGDIVTARQYVDPVVNPGGVSPPSNNARVVGGLRQPVIEIIGGEPFFNARANEEPIDGPVFPRGRGGGPSIRIQACCSKDVVLEILGPDGAPVAKPPLAELIPGYFAATWSWTSFSGWAVPGGIPVGRYEAVVRTGCDQAEARAPFYVIFNPADVGGPPRFSFDDTAVWFAGAGPNALKGLHYFLHPSDRRIFSIAINAARRKTDSYQAAIAVARAEESLFTYTDSSGTNDTIDQLLNRSEAQCADDACFLVALLRAVGIPAHPVTADVNFETTNAQWSFDTWIEFLATNAGATEWRVFHPHEFPKMSPESRSVFGARGVATKGFDDILIMANETWPFAPLDDDLPDITFTRNECGEPVQNLNKPRWIDELCEQGYWAQAHWDCAGVQPRSLVAGDGFRLVGGDLSFGGRVSGTVHLVNPTGERLLGSLVIELAVMRDRVKAISRVPSEGVVVSLPGTEPGRSVTVPFDLRIPETLDPGSELLLWARLNNSTTVVRRLTVPPRVAIDADVPRRLLEGEEARIRATVRNLTAGRVSGVVADLVVPFALQVAEGRTRHLEALEPHEAREVAWTVRALTHLRSGSIHVSLATADGGGVLLRRPFTVDPAVAAAADTEPVTAATAIR